MSSEQQLADRTRNRIILDGYQMVVLTAQTLLLPSVRTVTGERIMVRIGWITAKD